MNNKIKTTLLVTILSLSLGLTTNAAVKNGKKATAKNPVTIQKTIFATPAVYEKTNALDIVANPTKYLHKKVKIVAKFDKFSTLGLDYKPAFRSSEKYITFLIKRDDVINNVVPLSEMKNFLDRKTAEKYIDLKPGDIVEYNGTVFSDALSDAWIDVEQFNVISPKPADTKTIKK